jgi:replicative DNA helicase
MYHEKTGQNTIQPRTHRCREDTVDTRTGGSDAPPAKVSSAAPGAGEGVEAAAVPTLPGITREETGKLASGSDDGDWEVPIPLQSTDVPPFPIHCLPVGLRRIVEELSAEIRAPLDLAGMILLAVLAIAAAKKMAIQVRRGWVEPLNLYIVVALLPGVGKSPIVRALMEPLQKWESEKNREIDAQRSAGRSTRQILEKRLKRVQDQAAKLNDAGEIESLVGEAKQLQRDLDCMEVAQAPRLLADDVTPEKLASLLAGHGGRIGIIDAEGGTFETMAGRYSKGQPNLSVYLKGHVGDSIRVDRIGRDSEYVDAPAVTFGLAVQPDVIFDFVNQPGLAGRGLLARFLYAIPRDNVGYRDADGPPVSSAAIDEYRRLATALLQVPFARDESGASAPHLLSLSDDASEELMRLRNWIEPQLQEFGPLGAIRDWASKWVAHVARIAGLLHSAEHVTEGTPWTRPVEVDTIHRAAEIGRYLIPHARAAYGRMGGDERVGDAEHVMRWICLQGRYELTARDILEGTKGRLHSMMRVNAAIACLVEHGFLRGVLRPAAKGPGRPPSPSYEVNPQGRAQYSQSARV